MSINHLVPPRILGFLLFVLTANFLLTNCGSTANVELNRLDPVIEMSKGPCYGRCPVFTLTVYENGIASYEGERYTDRLGTYVKKLEKEEMQRLLGEFERANFWQFRDSYRGRIPDMQSVTITYREGGKKKSVTGKEIRPNAVKWLETQLDRIAQSEEGWILKEAPQDNVPDYLIPDQLLVELEEGVDPEDWAKKYTQADMLFERPLNDSGYWIFSYNDELITPEQMLEQVRMDQDVISAEFNKRIYNQMNEEEEDKEDSGLPPADAKKNSKAKDQQR